MELKIKGAGFSIHYKGRRVFEHSGENPLIYVGRGQEDISWHLGNFHLQDEITERIGLRRFEVRKTGGEIRAKFLTEDGGDGYLLTVLEEEGRLRVRGACLVKAGYNRLWFGLCADPDEKVWGLGEQYSAFNLRGRRYPVFTMEQGVGRNKKTLTTFLADQRDGGGGDYWTTYYPQATFVTSHCCYFHLDGFGYAEVDLRQPRRHGIHLWQMHFSALLGAAEDYPALLHSLTEITGRQPPMPDWAFEGLWLGLQGGSQVVRQRVDRMLEAGTALSAIWTQDWVGQNITSFGKRLRWNWRWNQERYPDLVEDIAARWRQGIAWMGYINPYLWQEGDLFREADEKGYLVKNRDGGSYVLDFGEFFGGFVDFTNPAAAAWYQGIIRENMLRLGLRGWMADFGEYLPTDCVLHSGMNPIEAHNAWPTLWAKVNYDALANSGLLGEVAFFTRSGAAHTQRYSPMMFAGDQNVDWSEDDGLPSVINAALSLAMTGFGMFTFDIGGYTALFGNKRSRELLLRGCEFAAFTPVMRSHEGNRPDINHQFDTDEETVAFFSRFSRIHQRLAPYLKTLARENCEGGIPAMRPVFFHYPQDEKAQTVPCQYLLGRDILVAPVVTEGATQRSLYLPEDSWLHLWSGQVLGQGSHTLPAPLGEPPVFFRVGSEAAGLAEALKTIR